MAVEVAVAGFRLFVEVLDEGIDVVLWPRAPGILFARCKFSATFISPASLTRQFHLHSRGKPDSVLGEPIMTKSLRFALLSFANCRFSPLASSLPEEIRRLDAVVASIARMIGCPVIARSKNRTLPAGGTITLTARQTAVFQLKAGSATKSWFGQRFETAPRHKPKLISWPEQSESKTARAEHSR